MTDEIVQSINGLDGILLCDRKPDYKVLYMWTTSVGAVCSGLLSAVQLYQTVSSYGCDVWILKCVKF